jgi:transketolase
VLHLTRTKAVNAKYERLGRPAATLDDIRRFRQLDSRAPGHLEHGWVSGVETTTGPLGQGVATSVGMAIAEKWLAHRYNQTGCEIFDITIEGDTSITFTEDVSARFLAYGWNVLRVGDGNYIDRIEHALRVFQRTKDRPTFIVLDSHIGYGSPNKQGSAAAHGEPLGEKEVRLASLEWKRSAVRRRLRNSRGNLASSPTEWFCSPGSCWEGLRHERH